MKKLIPFLFIIFLVSCRTKQFVTQTLTTTTHDTIRTIQKQIVYQAVNDTTIIENPCDSVGILNRFYAKISIPFGKVIAQGKGNRIVLSVKTDSLSSKSDSTYKSNDSKVISVKEKEVIKYRIPSWIIYTLIIETLLIALYVFLRIRKLIII